MNTQAGEERDFPINTPDGTIVAKQKTVASTEQKIEPLSKAKLQKILQWESEASVLVKTYLGKDSEVTLQTCDEAFSAWQREKERRFTESEVISYLGAYLGQKCVVELDMEWKTVTDEYGEDYAVHYKKGDVLGFPLSSVAKRIQANTHEFMAPVFYVIKQQIENGTMRRNS